MEEDGADGGGGEEERADEGDKVQEEGAGADAKDVGAVFFGEGAFAGAAHAAEGEWDFEEIVAEDPPVDVEVDGGSEEADDGYAADEEAEGAGAGDDEEVEGAVEDLIFPGGFAEVFGGRAQEEFGVFGEAFMGAAEEDAGGEEVGGDGGGEAGDDEEEDGGDFGEAAGPVGGEDGPVMHPGDEEDGDGGECGEDGQGDGEADEEREEDVGPEGAVLH